MSGAARTTASIRMVRRRWDGAGNGTNLNLNRDYLKADAPETRAFMAMFHHWLPDFFVDDHVTDGADYQYDVTFTIDDGPNLPAATAKWVDDVADSDAREVCGCAWASGVSDLHQSGE